ncbi:hypothetical protein COT65_01945 [Candidatus Shapirobacteria bacterium CG09_land_8_20_14_0_10_47_13]|uniref:Uncharacterized protein n=2 Tax=Microgenomates group TaxID=1794810 RepID=A0A2M7QJD1_9BACT|nr:MAG: hypothetical protein COT65_01945 [Candidatus Shapirobacteria bacterium CG09_land_8_20_14_0_10_47_13]PIY72423.1 MAG: hypothetical protein COY87_01060 [Candidatus Roizmanbacteria bacterium CG_4_10_14_0_8_um_filter_33_9]
MENLNERKLRLLENIGKLIKAIDDEIDWFISSFMEMDPKRRTLARNLFYQKQEERAQLAKEAYERFK